MNLEINYNGLFILINCVFSMVNLILLIFSLLRYRRTQLGGGSRHIRRMDDQKDCAVDAKECALDTEPSQHDLRCAEVLMSKATEDRLIEQFKKAEESKFFLKKGVSLKDLAHLLGTNQRYVSYILSRYVGLDFNNYIQHARIDYVISCIERDPDLLQVKFSVLAEKAGFSSISKFSSVFKTVKGIPPSEYFQRMRITL